LTTSSIEASWGGGGGGGAIGDLGGRLAEPNERRWKGGREAAARRQVTQRRKVQLGEHEVDDARGRTLTLTRDWSRFRVVLKLQLVTSVSEQYCYNFFSYFDLFINNILQINKKYFQI
jgi:hypothetical protein